MITDTVKHFQLGQYCDGKAEHWLPEMFKYHQEERVCQRGELMGLEGGARLSEVGERAQREGEGVEPAESE